MLPADAANAIRELFHFCYWLARTYGRTSQPDPGLRFDADLVPKAAAAQAPAAQTAEQLQKLETELHERDAALRKLQADKAELDEELKKLREEVAAAKKANAAQPDNHDYSEAETRKAFIDLLLKEAGWELDPAKNFEVEVTGMPNGEGTGYVDYVLWGDDGKPLALIEAKRTTQEPDGRPAAGQALRRLPGDSSIGQRPVIFYSNGYEHWIWDDAAYPPRPVQGFYKKAELELLIQRRTSRKTLAEAIDQRRHRRALLPDPRHPPRWRQRSRWTTSARPCWSWPPAPARPAPSSRWPTC